MSSHAFVSEKRSARFNRSQRLLEAKDFKNVFDSNQFRTSNQHILILAVKCARPFMTHSRLVIVVSKKHSRRAVDRNRIKRMIRECFRQHVASSIHCIDYIVLARPGLDKLSRQNIASTLKLQFDHIAHKITHEKKAKAAESSHEK